jgi:antitoxin ParD1/3/4
MPTRNVNLTPELDHFITARVKTGRYENASEVVRAALRSMQREETEEAAKLKALREAFRLGVDSGIAKGDVMARVYKRLKLRPPVSKAKKLKQPSRAA